MGALNSDAEWTDCFRTAFEEKMLNIWLNFVSVLKHLFIFL